MIKSINCTNFKGATMALPLTGIDLIVGPNMSGKTRVAELLEYAFTGSLAGMKKPADIHAEYASGGELKVIVETSAYDLIRSIKRKVTLLVDEDGEPILDDNDKPQKEIKYTSKVAIKRGKETLVTGAKNVSEFLDNDTVKLAFSFYNFLQLSMSDKRDAILNLVGYAEPTEEELKEVLMKVKNVNDQRDCIDVLALQEMIEIATANKSYYNREKGSNAGGLAVLTKLKNELEGNISKISKLKETEKEQAETLNDLFEKKKHQEVVVRRMADDKAAIESFKVQLDKLVDESGRLKEIEEEIKELDSKIQDVSILYDKNKVNNVEMQKLEAQMKQDKSLIDSLFIDIEKFSSATIVCPYSNMECGQDFSEYVEGLKKKYDEAKEHEKKVSTYHDNLRRENESRTNEIASMMEHNHVLHVRINELKEEHGRLTIQKDHYETKKAHYESEIKRIESKENESYIPEEELKPMLIGANSALHKTRADLLDLEEKRRLSEERSVVLEKKIEAEENWTYWTKLLKELKAFKAQCLLSKIEPIEESINEVITMFGKDDTFKLVLVDANEKDQFQFALTGLGDKPQVRTRLSGFEHVMIYMGVIKAFGKMNGMMNYPLIIDELMLIDEDNLRALMQIQDSTDNYSNILLLSPAYPKFDHDYNVIKLGDLNA